MRTRDLSNTFSVQKLTPCVQSLSLSYANAKAQLSILGQAVYIAIDVVTLYMIQLWKS
jgi:hypothetical protein